MSSLAVNTVDGKQFNMNLKQLKLKANEFLGSRKQTQHLIDIIKYFEVIKKK